MNFPILSLVTFLPLAGAVLFIFIHRSKENLLRYLALATTIITFIISLFLYFNFNSQTPDPQFVEESVWLGYGIDYHIGIDGISLFLVLLTTFLGPIVILSSWTYIQKRVKEYLIIMLMLETGIIGVFVALNLFLFYVFWEAMLIPMYFLIGVWGGPRKIYATIKFVLYTLVGSLLMLVAILGTAFTYMDAHGGAWAGAFDFEALRAYAATTGFPDTLQLLAFAAFFLAFAIKVPMFPFHTWLPDAHVEAPTGGSVILAAIMLKIGGYGFLRFSLPIAPDASASLDWLIISMSLIAVAYIGLVAMVQVDMKKLIAYSSIAHMGFVTLGFFLPFSIYFANGNDLSGAALAVEGGMVQMISHGFISAALFLCIGVMYDRLHSREIKDYGGVVVSMPIFASFMVLFALANSGLPGTSGFVGEFMVILASIKSSFWIALVAATTLILGAAYSLWLVKRVVFGKITNEKVAEMQDLDRREFVVLGSLAFTVLLFGVWPDPLVEVMHPTIDNLLRHIVVSKI